MMKQLTLQNIIDAVDLISVVNMLSLPNILANLNIVANAKDMEEWQFTGLSNLDFLKLKGYINERPRPFTT